MVGNKGTLTIRLPDFRSFEISCTMTSLSSALHPFISRPSHMRVQDLKNP